MNVTVLLAGVADPKWPLAAVSEAPAAARARNHLVLSPFDEAALETGLKVRDGADAVRLTVAMSGGPESEPLVRKAAAFRPDRTVRIDAAGLPVWDARALAGRLAAVLAELDSTAGLVLIGREFGDFDSGAVPPCLAAALGVPFFGLAQHARRDGRVLTLTRERGGVEESVAVTGALVASVTNDRRNRLRHPLMKNVMEARRQTIPVLTASAAPGGPPFPSLVLKGVRAAPPPARDIACRRLAGPPDAQVAELAAFLEPWRSEA